MITLKRLTLNNIVYFDKATLDLTKAGLTFVRGVNYDSDLADPTSNGAGKSLLFSCLPNVLYQAPPTAIKKNSKKDLHGKDSFIEVILDDGGTPISIVQTPKGYTISEDGKDIKISRIPDAEKYIRNVFPLSEIDYYTYCYLSTSRPYPMQSDSDLNRLEHLTAIFGLERYDQLRAYFAKKLSLIKSEEVRLSVIENSLSSILTDLDSLNDKKPVTEKSHIEEAFTRVTKRLETLKEKNLALAEKGKQLEMLLEIEGDLDKARKLWKYDTAPKDAQIGLMNQRKVLLQYIRYKDSLNYYMQNKDDIEAELLDIPKDLDYEALCQRKVQLTNTIKDLEAEVKETTSRLRELKRLEDRLADINEDLDGANLSGLELERNYIDKINSCVQTKKLETLIHEGHSVCPTCLSSVDVDNIKSLVKQAKKDLQRYTVYAKAQVLIAEKKATVEAIATKPLVGLRHQVSTEKLVKYVDELGIVESNIEKAGYQRKLLKRLAALIKPDTVKKPNLDITLDDLDNDISLCNSIMQQLAAKAVITESLGIELKRASAVSAELETVSSTAIRLKKKIKELQNNLSELSVELDSHIRYDTQHQMLIVEKEKLQRQVKEIKPKVDDKSIIAALVQAYSPKGLKTIAADDICRLLENGLNIYSSLVFAEPFSFTIKVTDSGCSILCDRQNGKISDVRTLSGAESNCFRLLFSFTLLTLMPDSRRVNVMILDEPFSHCDEVSRSLCLNTFLPQLQDLVPNIYIITPNRSDYIEGSKEIEIVKSGGVSTVNHL